MKNMEEQAACGRWYHATRQSCVEAIRREGLRTAFYGAIHGITGYPPVAPSVYLSRNFPPQNLCLSLFDDPANPVVILEVDGAGLDPRRIHPDDMLGQILARDFLEYAEDENDLGELAVEFADRFGLDPVRADTLLRRCMDVEDEREYPAILKDMWVEYAAAEGEIAYAADVPPEAIGPLHPWPEAEGDPEP